MQHKSSGYHNLLVLQSSEYILESLFSVNQDYPCIELIIVDDCSTDDSKAIIENGNLISKTQFIANKTNLGSTKSFNKALNKSNGDYIIDLAALAARKCKDTDNFLVTYGFCPINTQI
jgi:GT2 family glycosyltransferase